MLMAPDADCPLHGRSGGRRSQLTKLAKQPFRNVVNWTAVNDEAAEVTRFEPSVLQDLRCSFRFIEITLKDIWTF